MGNNKGNGIFLGVIGVATLLVAIIGATFAFFGANIASGEAAVSIGSTTLSLGYKDSTDGLKTNLIPAEDYIADWAAMEQLSAKEVEEYNKEHEDEPYDKKLQCIDDNGNEVCGTYTFTIGNPSFTTAQDLYGSIKVAKTEMTDLYFSIYDENEVRVVEPTAFSTASEEGVIDLPQLNQKLLASSSDAGKTPEKDATDDFDSTDPTTYTKVNGTCTRTKTGGGTEEYACSNRRTYKMIIWIKETGTNQTAQSGKTFTAGVTFTTASDKSGVTGVIAAAEAKKPQTPSDN